MVPDRGSAASAVPKAREEIRVAVAAPRMK
jgi:hypothetical protein